MVCHKFNENIKITDRKTPVLYFNLTDDICGFKNSFYGVMS